MSFEVPIYMAHAREIAAVIEATISAHAELQPLLAQYPRDMITFASHGLDIPVIVQPGLSVHSAARYLCILAGRDASRAPLVQERRLFGLLHVGPPTNLILLDEQLSSRMKRYVVAHELGHFVGDLLLVRQRWLTQLPNQRAEVLRAFQWHEYDGMLDLEALVRGLPPRPRPILARGDRTAPETWTREIQADLVARELLAPWDTVAPRSNGCSQVELETTLRHEFGLPTYIARYYAADIRHACNPPKDLIDRLFGSLRPGETSS